MKTAVWILLAVVLSVAANRLVPLPEPPAGPARAAAVTPQGVSTEALLARILKLEEANRLLEQSATLLQDSSEKRLPVGEIEQIVEAILARQAEGGRTGTELEGPVDPDEVTAAEGTDEKLLTKDEFFARLSAVQGGAEAQALWQEAREAGLFDELLSVFEERAKNAPGDSQIQTALGNAYLQQLFGLPDGPQKGVVATKADSAFDRALAIDDHNWDARYSKAVSLSFWPPVFGKQAEAIRNFEVLVDQQASLAPNAQHATSHLWLGNLYQQMGKEDAARAAWATGLELFPNNEELRQQVASLQD